MCEPVQEKKAGQTPRKAKTRKTGQAAAAPPQAEQAAGQTVGNVTVVYGNKRTEVPLAGKTVAWARQRLTGNMNIPTDAEARVKQPEKRSKKLTTAEEATFTLNQGDTLEFVKLAGDKG